MTPDDAFLQAVIENPADDLPRLMYADWLENTPIRAASSSACSVLWRRPPPAAERREDAGLHDPPPCPSEARLRRTGP